MGTMLTDVHYAQTLGAYPGCKEVQELTEVVVRNLPYFHRMALRELGNSTDAEDAVQDALLSAYRHLYQFKGQAQMSTWVTRIVINAARMRLRGRALRLHIPLERNDGEHDTVSEALFDHRPNPEAVCRKQELAELVPRLCARLSPILRTAFQLREVEGLSIRETAQVLGIPEGTVKARVARARAFIKQLLEKCPGGKRSRVI